MLVAVKVLVERLCPFAFNRRAFAEPVGALAAGGESAARIESTNISRPASVRSVDRDGGDRVAVKLRAGLGLTGPDRSPGKRKDDLRSRRRCGGNHRGHPFRASAVDSSRARTFSGAAPKLRPCNVTCEYSDRSHRPIGGFSRTMPLPRSRNAPADPWCDSPGTDENSTPEIMPSFGLIRICSGGTEGFSPGESACFDRFNAE